MIFPFRVHKFIDLPLPIFHAPNSRFIVPPFAVAIRHPWTKDPLCLALLVCVVNFGRDHAVLWSGRCRNQVWIVFVKDAIDKVRINDPVAERYDETHQATCLSGKKQICRQGQYHVRSFLVVFHWKFHRGSVVDTIQTSIGEIIVGHEFLGKVVISLSFQDVWLLFLFLGRLCFFGGPRRSNIPCSGFILCRVFTIGGGGSTVGSVAISVTVFLLFPFEQLFRAELFFHDAHFVRRI
mmetsp:Transcript_6704/g.16737  ORF Transcript_6704/g.16737 Transcript_6704/m.16737 type:complete len:237 (-) Transcript_6704:701-1411(-)